MLEKRDEILSINLPGIVIIMPKVDVEINLRDNFQF
jgi:hypothetical protein